MNNFTSPGKGEKLASILTFHTPSPQTCFESQMMLQETNWGLLLLCLFGEAQLPVHFVLLQH